MWEKDINGFNQNIVALIIFYVVVFFGTHTHTDTSSHPQSDPFVEIAKAQEGGVFTVVYRSQPIMKTLDPKYVSESEQSKLL